MSFRSLRLRDEFLVGKANGYEISGIGKPDEGSGQLYHPVHRNPFTGAYGAGGRGRCARSAEKGREKGPYLGSLRDWE